MFAEISEYIKLEQIKRQSHLDLNSECIEIGTDSRSCRALLAHTLKTTVPNGIRDICLCHACHNGKCSNPKHLYWGTQSENTIDKFSNPKTKNVYKGLNAKFKNKIGAAAYAQHYKSISEKANLTKRNKLIALNEERKTKILNSSIDFSKFGWVQQVSILIEMSPQKINSWMKKNLPSIIETAFKKSV